jgi:hypothetical protein
VPTIEPRHIELALDVRRGKYRLRDLKDDAGVVNYILQSTSDARLAQIALEQRPHARERAWNYAKPRSTPSPS